MLCRGKRDIESGELVFTVAEKKAVCLKSIVDGAIYIDSLVHVLAQAS